MEKDVIIDEDHSKLISRNIEVAPNTKLITRDNKLNKKESKKEEVKDENPENVEEEPEIPDDGKKT